MNKRQAWRTVVALLAMAALVGGAADTARADPQPRNWAHLQNNYSKKCAVVQGHRPEAPAFQFSCVTSYDDQYWKFERTGEFEGTNLYQIRSKFSGMCLGVRNHENQTNGARVVQTICGDAYINTSWYVDPDNAYFHSGEGAALIGSDGTNMCLAQQHSMNNGQAIVIARCNPRYTDQQWSLTDWRP